jgi:hypothetical protein
MFSVWSVFNNKEMSQYDSEANRARDNPTQQADRAVCLRRLLSTGCQLAQEANTVSRHHLLNPRLPRHASLLSFLGKKFAVARLFAAPHKKKKWIDPTCRSTSNVLVVLLVCR